MFAGNHKIDNMYIVMAKTKPKKRQREEEDRTDELDGKHNYNLIIHLQYFKKTI